MSGHLHGLGSSPREALSEATEAALHEARADARTLEARAEARLPAARRALGTAGALLMRIAARAARPPAPAPRDP